MTFLLHALPLAFIVFGNVLIAVLRGKFFGHLSGPFRWAIETAFFVALIWSSLQVPRIGDPPFTAVLAGCVAGALAGMLLQKLIPWKASYR